MTYQPGDRVIVRMRAGGWHPARVAFGYGDGRLGLLVVDLDTADPERLRRHVVSANNVRPADPCPGVTAGPPAPG